MEREPTAADQPEPEPERDDAEEQNPGEQGDEGRQEDSEQGGAGPAEDLQNDPAYNPQGPERKYKGG